MPGDVLWIPEVFCYMWRLSSIDKDSAREKSPALRGGGWTWMQPFVCKNMIKESRAVGADWNFANYFFNLLNFVYQKFNTPLPRIFQISEKLNNIIQVHGMSSQLSCGGRGVLLRILGGGVPRGALNPDPILDQKCHFSHPFSDLVPKKFMSSLIHRLEQQQKTRIHI